MSGLDTYACMYICICVCAYRIELPCMDGVGKGRIGRSSCQHRFCCFSIFWEGTGGEFSGVKGEMGVKGR